MSWRARLLNRVNTSHKTQDLGREIKEISLSAAHTVCGVSTSENGHIQYPDADRIAASARVHLSTRQKQSHRQSGLGWRFLDPWHRGTTARRPLQGTPPRGLGVLEGHAARNGPPEERRRRHQRSHGRRRLSGEDRMALRTIDVLQLVRGWRQRRRGRSSPASLRSACRRRPHRSSNLREEWHIDHRVDHLLDARLTDADAVEGRARLQLLQLCPERMMVGRDCSVWIPLRTDVLSVPTLSNLPRT